DQHRRRSDQSQNESLLLLHLTFGVRRQALADAAFQFLKSFNPKRRRRYALPAYSKLLHRIITTGAKWLTTKQSPGCHANSAQSTMAFNRFARVFGTGRNKTTGRRQPGRDYCLVELQKRNKNKAHRQIWSAVASASARHR